jgi:hypothetical protein
LYDTGTINEKYLTANGPCSEIINTVQSTNKKVAASNVCNQLCTELTALVLI